jgi:hypothetical protein
MSEAAAIGLLFVYRIEASGFAGYVLLAAQSLVLSCSDYFGYCVAVSGISMFTWMPSSRFWAAVITSDAV